MCQHIGRGTNSMSYKSSGFFKGTRGIISYRRGVGVGDCWSRILKRKRSYNKFTLVCYICENTMYIEIKEKRTSQSKVIYTYGVKQKGKSSTVYKEPLPLRNNK